MFQVERQLQPERNLWIDWLFSWWSRCLFFLLLTGPFAEPFLLLDQKEVAVNHYTTKRARCKFRRVGLCYGPCASR